MSKAMELAGRLERYGEKSLLSRYEDDLDDAAEELCRLATIEQAAIALIKCRGRYHAKQHTKALAEALGIELPHANAEPDMAYPRPLKDGGDSMLTNC